MEKGVGAMIEFLRPTRLTPNHLTGFFVPFHEKTNQPSLINMPGHTDVWVAVYSTVEKLEESSSYLGLKNYKIVPITDGVDFANSIFESGRRIMLDPFALVSENKTRWTEIVKG